MAKACIECPAFRQGNGVADCDDGNDINKVTGRKDGRFPFKRPWCFGGLWSSRTLSTPPESPAP